MGFFCLHQNRRRITTRAKRGLFPVHLTINIDFIEAALANIINAQWPWHYYRKLLKGETDPSKLPLR